MKEKSFLQQQAYDTIKSSILSGEMEPNRLYSETKLSAQIGISRTPVREALQCLSQDGYITVIPSKGFMIRQLNDKDMKKKDLCEKAGISPASVTKMGRNGHVTTEILVKICAALDCGIEDIIEIVPDEKQPSNKAEPGVMR